MIAGRSKQRQRGQAAVIVALSLVVLVGLVGLAADGGHAFVDRRALQSGSDVSSEAGTSLLAYNFHQPVTPKTDPQVLAAIQAQVNSSLSSGNQRANFPGSQTYGPGGCDTAGALTDPATVDQIAGTMTASCAWYVDGSDPATPTTQKKLLLWPSPLPGGAPAGATIGHPVQVGQLGTQQLKDIVCPSTEPAWTTHCIDGTSVLAYYTHPTYFMRAIGQATAAERAIATSTFAPTVAVGPTGGFAHYAVWAFCVVPETDPIINPDDIPGGTARDNDANHLDNPADEGAGPPADADASGNNEQEVDLHDLVIIRDNAWHTIATGCSPAQFNSNNFKGWFHDPVFATPSSGSIPPAPAFKPGAGPPPYVQCASPGSATKTSFTELDYFCARGGNAVGNEAPDLALLQNAWDTCVKHTAPCVPVLLPVIDYVDEQTASSIVFHIKSWIAGVPTQDPSTYNSNTTVTVRVVDLVAHRGGWNPNCPNSPCPPPPPNAPVSINLVQ